MTEIIPGLYQLQLPLADDYLEHINVYLIRENKGYLLVDTGWNTEKTFNSLKQQLNSLRIKLTEIHQIVVTHFHADHCGLAGRLKQISGAKISLHYLEKDLTEQRYVNMGDFAHQMEQWLLANGVPLDEPSGQQASSPGMSNLVSFAPPDDMLQGDETISAGSFNFKVMWTPGHSPGHICLYEPTQKVLISGDHILPTITSNIGLHPQTRSNPLGDFLNSLSQMRQLEVKLILPAHGNVFADLPGRIDQLVSHHERRKAEIRELLKAGPKTAYQLVLDMTWLVDTYVNGIPGHKLKPWNRRMAVLEAAAHLESMRVDGEIDKLLKDGIVFYNLV